MHPNTIAKALTAYLAEPLPPFDWRSANCVHFAGAFVAQIEGHDPLAGEGMPATRAAARRLVRARGGFAALVTAALQREPIPVTMARLGDVVLMPVPGLEAADAEAQALGLCCGEVVAVRDEAGAVLMLPLASAVAAWRVGAAA
ncbi:MAG: hypothetical protein O9341_10945 [Paucibacter sp.]|nr:hypothetical protein [Roseateles sp.]